MGVMKECEYCKTQRNAHLIQIDDSIYPLPDRFSMIIEHKQIKIWAGDSAARTVVGKIPINYCPMCGNKL